jgi:hypothetical protein
VCFVAAAVLWLGPALARDDLFDNDATHHVFWLYRYVDPGLFPNDPSAAYFSTGNDAAIGYRILYAFLAPLVDILTAAEWLSVVLLGSVALFAFLIGRESVDDSAYRDLAGLASAALAMALLSRIDLLPPMALQRSFGMPLTLMCLWGLVSHRYRWVGTSWILSALIYPVLIPVLGLSAGIMFLAKLLKTRKMPANWIWNGISGSLAVMIVLLDLGTPDHVGPAVTYQEALQMPEFGPDGRQVLFGVGWHDRVFLHHRTGIGVPLKILLTTGALGLAAVAVQRRHWIPQAAIVMGGTGLALWGVARLTMFALYLPNRHSRWTLAAAVIAVLGPGAVAVLAHAVMRLERAWPRVRAQGAVIRLATMVAPVIVIAALHPAFVARWNRPVQRDLERAYTFLRTLPEDTLVAAHPDLADNVPLRARRSVLASTEAAIAFHRGYYSGYVPRIEASLDAAYATDWAELDARLAPYGVDVVLSSSSVFRRTTFYAPFDARVARLTSVDASAFVLRHPPPDRVLFQSGDVMVVQVRVPR